MKILRLRFTTAVDGAEHELDLRPILDASSCVIELPPGTTAQAVLESAGFALHGTVAAGIERVALELELGADTYRVARRAGGEAGLWHLPAGSAEGKQVATGSHQVTSEIEILLGYTEQELRQVVLLAQREFGRLLEAAPSARVEMLERMLEREIHRRIDQELGQVAEDKLQGASESRDVILRLVTALLEPRRSEAYTFQELAEQRDSLDRRLAVVTSGLERLRSAETSAGRLLEAAERRTDGPRELSDAEAALAALEAQRPDVERWRRLLRVGRPADALASPLADALAHAAACERRALAAQEQAAQALEEARSARAALAAEQSRDPERDAARRDLESFEALQRAISARDEARRGFERAEAAVAREQSRHDEVGASLAGAQRQLVEEEQVQPESDVDPVELARVRAEHDEANAALARVRRVETLRHELRDAARVQGRAKTRLADVEEQLDRARRDRLRRAGAPPGLHAAEAQAVESLAVEAESLRDQEAAAAARITQVRTDLRAIMDEVGLLAYDTQLVEARARAAQERLERLSAGETRVIEAAENARRLRDECHVLRDRLEGAEVELRSAVAARESARGALARAESGLPDATLGADAVTEAARRSRERQAVLARALAEAEAAASRAGDLLAQREQLVRAAREAERDASRRVEELRDSRTRRLAESGLTSEEERLMASAGPTELARREQQVQDFEAHCQAAQERVRRARDGRGRPRPSVPQLEQLLAQVRDAVGHVERQESALAESLGRLDDVDDLAVQLSEVGDVWEVVRRIAEVARGRNPVGQTFQRFVLSGLLDDLLDLATRRLRRMTRGRFHLQRRTTPEQWHVQDRIEIELHDAITGTIQPAEHVSDEDSFRSSLALALALADLVQAGAGGVRVDTLLVDGSDGAWSGDALATVLEALGELHSAGRSIAILTNDPSLRARAARLRETRLET